MQLSTACSACRVRASSADPWSIQTATTSPPGSGRPIESGNRTVLRGGYAIFYQALDRVGSSAALSLNPPQLIEFRGYESQFDQPPQLLLRDPYPGGSNEFNPQSIDLSKSQHEWSGTVVSAVQRRIPVPDRRQLFVESIVCWR